MHYEAICIRHEKKISFDRNLDCLAGCPDSTGCPLRDKMVEKKDETKEVVLKAKKLTKLPIKHSDITKQILDYLIKCRPDIFAWKQWQGPMSQEGVSDILGIRKMYSMKHSGEKERWENVGLMCAQFMAIEIKRPGGKPTPAQQRFIDNVNEAGGLAFCVHSLEECIEKLEG